MRGRNTDVDISAIADFVNRICSPKKRPLKKFDETCELLYMLDEVNLFDEWNYLVS